MTRRQPTAAELLAQLQQVLAQGDQPANDDEAPMTPERREAIRARARKAAERMRRARNS